MTGAVLSPGFVLARGGACACDDPGKQSAACTEIPISACRIRPRGLEGCRNQVGVFAHRSSTSEKPTH